MSQVISLTLILFFGFVLLSCESKEKNPNIIFILADDLGYQGSRISTPNLDALVNTSIRFPNFYNAGTCSPSRASFLAGQYPHRVGCGSNGKDYAVPSYRGFLSPNCQILPQQLKSLGYRTYMSGMWQMGWQDGLRPLNKGFDQAFHLGKGGVGGTYLYPFVHRNQAYPILNEKPITYDKSNFYSTDAFTEFGIGFIQDHVAYHSNQPFFLYLSYNAPHFPLQAKPGDIAKYIEVFSDG